MPQDLVLGVEKIPIYTSLREKVDNAFDGLSRRGRNKSRDKDSPSIMWRRTSRSTGVLVEDNFLYHKLVNDMNIRK